MAEDLVQETFLAAVPGYEKFGSRSSERSWLVGTLKNKIVDQFRKLRRETSFTDMHFPSDEFPHQFTAVTGELHCFVCKPTASAETHLTAC
jgi:RNA polymerase sigma-70 factor (ECF subfamily)